MDNFDAQGFPRFAYEMLVLAALSSSRMHGYQIALHVEELSGGLFVLQHGTLYPILHRLEGEGLIGGTWTGGRGERQKKVYVLKPGGRRRLVEGSGRVRQLMTGLNAILQEAVTHVSAKGA
jgi:PadR family transcriptional regulator